jgi:hypothetical protein
MRIDLDTAAGKRERVPRVTQVATRQQPETAIELEFGGHFEPSVDLHARDRTIARMQFPWNCRRFLWRALGMENSSNLFIGVLRSRTITSVLASFVEQIMASTFESFPRARQ